MILGQAWHEGKLQGRHAAGRDAADISQARRLCVQPGDTAQHLQPQPGMKDSRIHTSFIHWILCS